MEISQCYNTDQIKWLCMSTCVCIYVDRYQSILQTFTDSLLKKKKQKPKPKHFGDTDETRWAPAFREGTAK